MTETITLDDGQRAEIPDGLVAMVWERPGGSLRGPRPSSLLHLADAQQGERPYQSLCGQRRPRRARLDPPSYASGICMRCARAAEAAR